MFISFQKPHVIGQKVDTDFKIVTSSVNEAHSNSTMPTSGNYICMSRKRITTHNIE